MGKFWLGLDCSVVEQLKLSDVRCFEAPYGELPDLTQIDFDRDVVLHGMEQLLVCEFLMQISFQISGKD
ncbi:hypothetical protein ABID39_001048 [Bartonella japonica]|uniref:Uncharacterized protein n=1 Tax=Bartonella japonica TaxID=357761 RepID=A0ABV2FP49_9HYPH